MKHRIVTHASAPASAGLRKNRRPSILATSIATLATSLLLASSQCGFAASASWLAAPVDGNWEPAVGPNWSTGGATFPGATSGFASADVATFNVVSTITSITINNPSNPPNLNISGITFTGSASNYTVGSTGGQAIFLTDTGTIQIDSSLTATDAMETVNAPLIISGGGIYNLVNNSANGAGAGAGTLNLGGGITGNGGTVGLTLAGSNTNANTIGGVIGDGGGTVALTKSGAGTWVLSGVNTYSGGTTISGGTLAISNDNNLGATTGGVTFNNNAILQTTAGVTFDAARTFTINASGGTIDADGQTSTLNGEISGAGILSVINSALAEGKLTLTADNSGLTGGLTVGSVSVSPVTVAVSADNNLGATSAVTSIQDNGTVEMTASFSTARTFNFPNSIGNFNVDPLVTTTLTGSITGTGDMQLFGGGTLIITGNNPGYSGTTILSGGSLFSDVAAAGAGNQAFGTGLLNILVSGVIVGTHVAGEFIPNPLDVQADFSIASGPSSALTFSGPVTLVNDFSTKAPHTATIINAGNVIFSGVMSGTGGITYSSIGGGEFILNGTAPNTYAGTTNLIGGVIVLLESSGNAIPGSLSIDGISVVAVVNNEQIGNSAPVTVNSPGQGIFKGLQLEAGVTETIGALNGSSAGVVGLGSGTLIVGSGNFAGVITDGNAVFGSGGQLVKNTPGTLILTGANTYTGNTTINGGLLQVDGSIASPNTFVNPGGTLGGRGFIGGNVLNAGTVSPGDSPGTLTIKGNYTQTSGGTLVIQIAGAGTGQHDLLAVQGHASLDGTLRLVSVGGPKLKLGQKIPFLTAGGGVSGQFATVVDPFNTGTIIGGKIIYGPNEVDFEGAQGSFEQLTGLTPNQKAVAGNLDHVLTDPRAAKLISFLDSERLQDLPGDFDKIAPEELTSVYTLGVSLATVQSLNVQRRTDDIRSGSSGFNAANLALNGDNPSFSGSFRTGVAGPNGEIGLRDDGKEMKETKEVAPADNRWGVFLSGTGEWVSVGNTDNARGYDLESGGFTLGVDYKVTPNLAIGLAAGYTGTTADLVDRGRIWVNGGQLGLYATFFQNEQAAPAPTMSKDSSKEAPAPAPSVAKGFYADVAVFGGYNSYDTRRSALQGEARGDTDGGELNVLFGTGYDFKAGGLTFGPTATFNYTYIGTSDFTEHGSLAPLNVHGGDGESLRTALGFKVSYDWKVGGVIIKPELRAAWQHEYGDAAYAMDSSFASGAGNSFLVNWAKLGRDSALLGAGFAIQFNERLATYFYYDGELGRTNYQSTNVTGGVRLAF